MLRAVAGAKRWAFEGRLGVHTSAVVRLEDLGLEAGERQFYAPAGWMTLNRILPRREVRPDDVFLDLGSGMGRVLIRAAGYRFARVIGVELSHELSAIARRNIDAVRTRVRCQDIELVTADATGYAIPDDVTVIFMNNPFRGSVFAAVVEQIMASLDRNPRRLRIIYRAPREEGVLAAHPRLRLVRRREWLGSPDKRVVMYEAA